MPYWPQITRSTWIYLFLFGLCFFPCWIGTAEELCGTEGSLQAVTLVISPSCPACHAQEHALNKLIAELNLPPLERVDLSVPGGAQRLAGLVHQIPSLAPYQGVVPITVVGDQFVIGHSASGQEQVKQWLAGSPSTTSFSLPWIGEIDVERVPLLLIAIVAGLLDGFNVCSLGALLLILGLVVHLRSRTLILIYGSVFILITAAVYLVLIYFWHRIFQLLLPYFGSLDLLIGFLAIGGGIYFAYQAWKAHREGLQCQAAGIPALVSLRSSLQSMFSQGRTWVTLFAVMGFAGLVTLIEFPCSAALPVTFAALLTRYELSQWAAVGYMVIFILFYLLDELLLFAIAVWSLKTWMFSPLLVKGAMLLASVALLLFGTYSLATAGMTSLAPFA